MALRRMRVSWLENPDMTAGWLVVGLPDMGNVAGIVVGHLNKKLETREIGKILAYPAQIEYRNGVTTETSAFSFRAASKAGVVTFTGEQHPMYPAELQELCESVLDAASDLRVERILAVGASFRGHVDDSPQVFAVVNQAELLEELKNKGVPVLEGEGSITGFNGLILGVARERGLEAVCLLGDIDDPSVPQPRAARGILEVLEDLVGIDINTEGLEDEAVSLEERMEEVFQPFGFWSRDLRPPGVT